MRVGVEVGGNGAGSAQVDGVWLLGEGVYCSIVCLLFERLGAVLDDRDLVTQSACVDGGGGDACVCCDSREEDVVCVCLLESFVECCVCECGVVGFCYACVMCMEEEEEIFVDLYAWGVADTETAGTVGSGKVALEIGWRWIFGRHVIINFFFFFGCSFALFVHAINPDDGSSSRGELSEQARKKVYEWFCRDSCWTEEILLEVDEEKGRHLKDGMIS